MEAFKEAWLAIDRQGRGYITSEDLNTYMRKQNYDESFVRKWQRLFDSENTGVIQLEVFCDVLGLNAKDIQAQARANLGGELPEGVSFISGDMSLDWQIKVAEASMAALKDCAKMSDVPKMLKLNLDRLYGQLWHVVIAQGQFWCYYGHEPGFSFVFQHGRQVFMVFKTPSN